MVTLIKESKKIKKPEKDVVLLVGLPGVGFIGRIAVKYIIEKLKGEQIATVLSAYFPPQVIMTKKGLMKPLGNEFVYVKTSEEKDILALVGDIQPLSPEGQFEVSLEVLTFAKKFNVKEIIAIGGYASGKLEGNKKVFVVANDPHLTDAFKKLGAEVGKAEGTIAGMAGLLPMLGKYYGVLGTTLLGETHGAFADAKSAKRVLEILTKYLSIKLDYTDLDKVAKEGEELMKKLKEEIKKQEKGDVDKLSYIR